MRRVFIILASIIFLLGIAVGIYYFFILPRQSTLTVSDGTTFGLSGDAEPGFDIEGIEGPVEAGEEVAPRLVRITEVPVALGAVAIRLPSRTETSVAGTSTATTTVPGDTQVRYVERASGNIYTYRIHDRILERISNRTLPGVQEASWLSDGSMAFVRYLGRDTVDRVDTYALPSTGEGGYALESGLSQATAVGTTTLVTLLPTASGSVATVVRPDGTNPRTLFSSPMSALRVHASDGPYIAATKPAAAIDGYAFTVGATGGFSRVLGPLRGLMVLPSPSGARVLYSYVQDRIVRMAILDRASGNTTTLPVATLSEKCAWTPDSRALYCGVPASFSGTLPDDWLQGAAAFNDRLWRIDMESRLATLVIDPSEAAGIDIDMTGLSLDPSEDALVFRNRLDGSLWVYDL